MPMSTFPYDLAFDRNLGWVTEWEQLALRAKRVAIAGMGGVGGVHLLTLARLGIGAFNIADFDRFEYANFNRQVGAMVSTIGRSKAEVLEEMARQINPELAIRRFDQGVQPELVEDFLQDADLFVDGLDFFEIGIRRLIFGRCRALGIPAVTAAPIGAGAGYLVFTPGGMSFDSYFGMEGRRPEEQFLRFLIGLVPKGLHRRYLLDPSRINLAARKGPSTAAAVQLCAGVTAAAALKILLRRPEVKPAPWHHHFDAYLDRMASTWLPFGLSGPIQRTKLALARRMIRRGRGQRGGVIHADPPAVGRSILEEVLNLARWAPSGDNAQPWRFGAIDDWSVFLDIQHAMDSPYEYDNGEPTILSVGMLLESMRIAASQWGCGLTWEPRSENRFLVRLVPDGSVRPDPLGKVLTLRSVDRRAYRRRPLSAAERHELEKALGNAVSVRWYSGTGACLRLARLNAMATDIRLRCPEAFPVHQAVIDWERRFSPQGIPATAVGLMRPMLPLFRWGLASWTNTERMNRLGTWGAAAQLDYLPALNSAAFAVFAGASGAGLAGVLAAGQAIQRFWLTATRLGLVMQPTIATIAFARYGETEHRFTTQTSLLHKAKRLAERFQQVIGQPPREIVFMARVGEPRPRLANTRSTRLSLVELMRPRPEPGRAAEEE